MRSAMLYRHRRAVLRRARTGADVGGKRDTGAARKHLRQGRYRRRCEQRQKKKARDEPEVPS